MNAAFEYVFPAIRGVQARREYYVSMCPLRLLPKIFLFNEEELVSRVARAAYFEQESYSGDYSLYSGQP
ncbi:MAG: hypothetical protein KatS3mg131_1122 [Candidatus Tectimicrobiota bacterium]|nr:MAG: hypothetical protein KatS3mg131_1122 [Candidatus Tectomicrobia bacterium]